MINNIHISIKALAVILAAAVMCVFCAGRAPDSCKGTESAESAAISRGQRLIEQGILIRNNIEIEQIYEDYSDPYYYSGPQYLEISGLKDKTVQDAVNGRIRDCFYNMLSGEYIPPYRGISVMLREFEGIEPIIHVYFSTEYNYNNILCVNANCSVYYSFQDESGEDFSFAYEVPMTFDLTTGKELKLGDLFREGTDYIEAVNEAVDRSIMQSGYDDGNQDSEEGDWGYFYDETAFASPFKGISPDQKFVLCTDRDISLVFDYETPEICASFYPVRILLEADRLEGLTDLGRTPQSPIYEDENEVFEFDFQGGVNRIRQSDETVEPGFSVHVQCYTSPDVPEKIVKELESVTCEKESWPVDLTELASELDGKCGKGRWTAQVYSYTNIYTLKNGRYAAATWNMEYYTESDDEDVPDSRGCYSREYCYDAETCELMDIYSLFVRRDDVSRLLEDSLAKSILKDVSTMCVWLDETDAEKAAGLLIPHINGVSPDTYGLKLSYDLSDNAIIRMLRENLGPYSDEDPDDEWYLGYGHYIYYEYAGCDNLVFFSGL